MNPNNTAPLTDQWRCFTQSSPMLPSAGDGNKYRDPQPDTE